MQDWQLLRDYLDNNSEAAFTELLNRHLGLVYSAVLRRVNDRHAAQDLTQSVFCLLVQKAPRLSKQTVIVGWLYRTACLKASEYIRSENRRQHRERSTIMIPDAATTSDDDWERTAPHLEEAMRLLDEQDRLAVLLRFFNRKPLREVGRVLGMSEDAARMRVNRALDRLRKQLASQGIHCAGTALGIMLSERAVEATSAEVLQIIRTAVFKASQVASVASPVPLFAGSKLKTWITTSVVLVGITTAVLCWRDYGGILPVSSDQPTPVEVLTAASTPQAGRLPPSRRSQNNRLISPAGPALDRLRQLLYSSVADLVYPTTDLEQGIKELNEHPDETIALLSEALNSHLKEPRRRAACAFGLVGPGAIKALPQLIEKARSDPELAQLLFPSAVRISPQPQLLA